MKGIIAFALLGFAVLNASAVPPNWPYVEISSNEQNHNDRFGSQVIVFGDTAFVTAPLDKVGTSLAQGSVYKFSRINGVWTQTQKITSTDGVAYDYFGVGISYNGGHLMVIAQRAYIDALHTGAIYEFTEDAGSGQFVQTNKFYPAEGQTGGYAYRLLLSITQNSEYVFVGAAQSSPTDPTTFGTVRIFHEDVPGVWTQKQLLTAPPHTPNIGGDWDGFGIPLDATNDHFVVGAGSANVNNVAHAGIVYDYTPIAGLWQLSSSLTTPDLSPSAWFGYSVSILGTKLLVGAPVEAPRRQGAVHVLSYSPSTMSWAETAQVRLGGGGCWGPLMHDCGFGDAVAWNKSSSPLIPMQPSFIASAAAYDAVDGVGGAMVFQLTPAGKWENTALLALEEGNTYEFADGGISFSDDTAIATTFNYKDFYNTAGVAVIFTRP